MLRKFHFLLFLALTLLSACASMPEKAVPVTNFEAQKYLGTWYEIARYDYRFEKNLDNVSANYSWKDDGNIRVSNSGYNTQKKEWKKALGTAKFRDKKDVGALKVSFFGPFYAGYNVIAIDKDYKYALVAGKSLDYLWILSREKTIPVSLRNSYLKQAQAIGYDTTALIWVKHDKKNPLQGE